MKDELFNFSRKVAHYKEVLAHTEIYRKVWKDSLKDKLVTFLEGAVKEVGLDATVEVSSNLENLEAVSLSLGTVKSGMYKKINNDFNRHMIKNNGSLIYQQLFNGKIIVIVQYPFIENYGEPRAPKTIAIYRPEELKDPFCVRHLEEFIQEITDWEDFDDDEPNKKIGFELNFPPPKEG
ncbi:MAG TPA: hypothetical protein ENJ95_13465 [Bacteroidetes bacterium]|nr:hypothetical protein [Bacteroidota bacterium]